MDDRGGHVTGRENLEGRQLGQPKGSGEQHSGQVSPRRSGVCVIIAVLDKCVAERS